MNKQMVGVVSQSSDLAGALAFCFLLLGAAVMYRSGLPFSSEGATFTTQFLDLYTQTIGGWIRPVILVLALTTMLSTVLTVLDGFPRVLDRIVALVKSDGPAVTAARPAGRVYWIAFLALGVGGLLAFFSGRLTTMLDFATGLAFLVGPILGYLNLRAVTSTHVRYEDQPGTAMGVYAYIGLVLLSIIAFAFIASRTPGALNGA